MVFDRYLFKNLLIATIFIAVTLAAVIFLTQSLRFLELVIQSGASGTAFWILTMLALPRFFEVILPIALMAGCLFVYNKMSLDQEVIVMRASGQSPLSIARPAIVLSIITVFVLWFMTMWLGPVSLSNMHKMRQVIKAQYSSLIFQEGVFNSVIDGLTVYIDQRNRNNELSGIMIHDNRDKTKNPITVLASRGVIVTENDEQKVVVYDGVRQDLNAKNGTLNRLDFERYTIELPADNSDVRQRWREPDERTLPELLNLDMTDRLNQKYEREFAIEVHRRIISPLLAPVFVLIALCFLFIGPVTRRGQSVRIISATLTIVGIQGFYLTAFNLANNSNFGLVLMYIITLAPLFICTFLLSHYGEKARRFIHAKIVKQG